VHEDPAWCALHSLGSKLIFLANDILGLEKDLRIGWPNVVSVLQQERRIPLAEAVAEAVELHNRELLRFIALEKTLPLFGQEVDPFVRLYVERMHWVICGFAHFERMAERYRWQELGAGAFHVSLCAFTEA
jgi:5-epi-alpha-selinene synthase